MPEEEINYVFVMLCLGALVIALVVIILIKSVSLVEHLYSYFYKKPLYTHFYFRVKKLSPQHQEFLKQNFLFYTRLSTKQQRFFQHRLVTFVAHKSFEGRDDFEITEEVKLYIGATAVMLTFGMRNFLLNRLQKIIIYPDVYFSTINKVKHKGEFNPHLKALVFSWKDFLEGFDNDKDNVNLAIHEFMHVIQINTHNHKNISAVIFSDANKELENLLKQDHLRHKLINSRYFREYAFTNRVEFLAVLVESFIESPQVFEQNFPEFYKKIKEMLNYHFAGY
ncbi:zinc-dependent peptidase [Mesonia sp. MT50]|uniref:Zinc-dependent peptidase n=1 Tax=Mesonia profundi TaxID=3070998 RepID=A0ABU1A1P2_9FLAO|nr:zinc-dependent peptidase [Mesonia profundi]MDQ7917610.1 zinc-dependent peptidase [Mesonia profundi]